VRVADSLDPDTPRGKQESHVYKRGGIWYQTISGPVRSVWIEPVERNRLRSRLGVVSAIEDGLVEFQLTARVHDPGRYHLRLVVSRPGDDRPLASAEMTLALEAGETRQYLALELADPSRGDRHRPRCTSSSHSWSAPTATCRRSRAGSACAPSRPAADGST
jgi:hypothetical protein